ncbi:hypothetical protein GCM10020331_081630 [Ectobacillus funiculus]
MLDRKNNEYRRQYTIARQRIKWAERERDATDSRKKRLLLLCKNPMNAFTPVYTIGNQFIETIRTHTNLTKKEAFELAVDSLHNVNLPNPSDIMRKYPFQLSGGMLQRVMIAISLCLRPAVIIADEPTTALDVTNQLQVLRQLDWIRSEYGTAILLISHDLGVISELADDVIVMQNGRIVEKKQMFISYLIIRSMNIRKKAASCSTIAAI